MKLQIVPARAGAAWVVAGVRTFARRPFILTGLFFAFMLLLSLLGAIPHIGTALMLMLVPAATLLFMVVTQEIQAGAAPGLWARALRAGRQELRALAILGVLYALLFAGVLEISTWVDGGKFARFGLGEAEVTLQTMLQPDFQAAMLLSAALNLLLSLLFWHAPALVHWHAVPPIKAMFFSLVACLRNVGAYTVFGLVWFGLLLSVSLPVWLIVGALGGAEAALAALMPLSSLFTAVFFTSMYFTFRDSFVGAGKSAASPAPTTQAQP